MSELTQAKAPPTPRPKAAPAGTLQRKCACGTHTVAGGECDSCGKKRLQRTAANRADPPEVPAVVHDVLNSPGRPLDSATRDFFEPRFAHDFSRVRLHTDARAAESARAVNALAYTVGKDVVFREGLYRPGTVEGRGLLAHELAHVVQQRDGGGLARRSDMRVGEADDGFEREADDAARAVVGGRPVGNISAGASHVQRAEVAGCKSDKMGWGSIGTAAHNEILRWCNLQNPNCSKLSIRGASSKGTGHFGYADLFFRKSPTSPTAEIGEIKPLTDIETSKGTTQLEGYIEKYQKQNPGLQVKMMEWEPGPPENGNTPFPNPTSEQYLFCEKVEDGHYFYWCEGQKKKQREPQKIPAPGWETKLVELLEKLRKRREQGQKVKEKGKEKEKPRKEEPAFQPSYEPEWVKVLKTIAAVFVVIIIILEIIAFLIANPLILAFIVALFAFVLIFLPILMPFIQEILKEQMEEQIKVPILGSKSAEGKGRDGGRAAGPVQEGVAASAAAPGSSPAEAVQGLASADLDAVPLTPEQAWELLEASAALAEAVQSVEGDDPATGALRDAASEVAAEIESVRQEAKA